jgi:L-ascorbate oxidase
MRLKKQGFCVSRMLAAGLLASAAAGVAHAQDRVVTNPRVLGKVTVPEALALRTQENLFTALPSPANADRQLHLKIVYTDGKIYNPATQTYDHVHLRSYNGTDVSPDTPYVAPTIEAKPGDTVRVELDNQLPADPTCSAAHMAMNTPHCFNGTNLHAHGLWVSPTGNSDNVLLTINPGAQFGYEYNIPRDHPAGTFWYHTHRHGSTALQVSSGMAGALIIRGNRMPSLTANGDLETLLYQGGKPVPEQILLFQQIQYGCLDKDGHIKVKTELGPDGKPKVVAWVCDPNDVGVIETYDDGSQFNSGFGPDSWAASGRYTSINGQVLATLKATSGQLARWRLIHAGVRDTIALQFQKMTPAGVRAMNGPAVRDGAAFKAAYCVGDPIPFYVVADDGLTTAAAVRKTQVTLQPAYRNDLLIVFPTAGDYCMINAAVTASGSVSQQLKETGVLGKVSVAKGQDVPNIDAFVRAQLVAAAKTRMPLSIRPKVVADLENGLKLTRFVAHPTVTDDEVAHEPVQKVLFNIDVKATPTAFEVGSQDYAPRPYQADRIDRTLILGHAQEWRLQSEFVSHPFHIHVNPFQIVAILDPNGKDVSAPGAVDDYAGGPPDPNYPGLKGVWKDTIWVKSAQLKDKPVGIYTVIVRTRYQRYIGEYVLHCHILDHEDQGMMQNVQIVLPGAAPMAMAMTP